MEQWISEILNHKKEILDSLETSGYVNSVERAGLIMIDALKNGNKLLLAGNGGSAADAQHFAGEIVGRFLMERDSIPAISLCTDPSVVTCIANDYGYEKLFAREVSGLGNTGDILIVISTSGNSKNCINAINVAHEKEMKVVGLLGRSGGAMSEICDISLVVPADNTPRIQEIHTLTVHLLCEMIEKGLFDKKK